MDDRRSREVARELIATMPVMMSALVSELRRFDDPMPMSHFRTLMMIAHGGPWTLTGLADRQHVSLPTCSNTVSLLVEHGWVERMADANDRRRTELRLTREGAAKVERAHGQVEDLLVSRLAGLSVPELDQVAGAFGVLRRAFGVTVPENGDVA